jgi:hypothetical protein
MNKRTGLLSKAVMALAALGGFATISRADFIIGNENISIGIDDVANLGNMLSIFEATGGRFQSGGSHDFWYDELFGEGFVKTHVAVKNATGTLIGPVKNNGLFWADGPTVTHQTDATSDSAIIEGHPLNGVYYRRVIRIDAGTNHARVTDTFRNESGMIINPGVLDNVNPLSPFSDPFTFNDLNSVLRFHDFASATIGTNDLTVGFGSDNLAFKFSAGGGQTSSNPFSTVEFDPDGEFDDRTIQSFSNYGLIFDGQEVSHTWYICFGTTKTNAIAEYVTATGASVFEIGPVGTQNIDEHLELVVPIPINNPGGGAVNWSVSGPAGMTIDAVGVIRWTPDELEGGNSYSVEVQADNGSVVATTSFTVNAIETNSPPIITDRSDVNVNEGALASLDFDGSDSDIPVQSLTFTLVSGPTGATVHPNTGQFSWQTNESHGPGTYPVTVRVTDDGAGLLSDDTTFNVIVAEVNQAPTLSAIQDQTVTQGVMLQLTATATDPDLPANTLTYSLEAGAPDGAAIDPNTGVFTWTPGPGTAGDHLIVVKVPDNGDPVMSDTEDFNVHVDAPSLVATYTGDHSAEYSDPTTLSARITDENDNPIPGLQLTFSLGSFAASDVTDSNGVASVSTILIQAAGNVGVTVSFAGNSVFDPFERTEDYEILREKVIVQYYGDENVVNGTNKSSKAAVRFFASAHQENDGHPGDFSTAMLLYRGFRNGNTSSPDVEVGPVPIDGLGRTAAFRSVLHGDYLFDVVTAPNNYWRVSPSVQVSMKIGIASSSREASGSGWVPFGADNGHGSLSFSVAYNKEKEKGSSSFDYVGTDGFRYVIEMTTFFDGALTFGVGNERWKSAITGLARVKRTKMSNGQSTTFDNLPVTIDNWDGDAIQPTVRDAYGIMVLGANGLIWLETPDILNLGGGNVKHR